MNPLRRLASSLLSKVDGGGSGVRWWDVVVVGGRWSGNETSLTWCLASLSQAELTAIEQSSLFFFSPTIGGDRLFLLNPSEKSRDEKRWRWGRQKNSLEALPHGGDMRDDEACGGNLGHRNRCPDPGYWTHFSVCTWYPIDWWVDMGVGYREKSSKLFPFHPRFKHGLSRLWDVC